MNKQILKIFLCFCQLFVRVRSTLIQSRLHSFLEPSVPSMSFCLSSLSFLSLSTRTPPLFLTTVRSVNYPLLTEAFSFLLRTPSSMPNLCHSVEHLYLTTIYGNHSHHKTAGSVFVSALLSPSHKTVLLLSPFTEVPSVTQGHASRKLQCQDPEGSQAHAPD